MNTTIRTSPRKKLLQALLLVIGICFINSAWAFKASFTYNVGSNGQVNFTSTSTGTSASTVYYWYPGNGGNGAGGKGATSFSYTYLYNGNYTAVLRIIDTLTYQYDSVFATIPITNSSICNVQASFTYTTGVNGLIYFNNTSTNITSSSNYNWNYGDGNSSVSNIANGIHQYTNNGTYYCSLTVTNGYGCSSTVYDSIIVNNDTAKSLCNVNASFTYTFGPNGQVTFHSTTTGASSSVHYSWNMGDSTGNINNGPPDYSHIYLANGTYIVTLMAYSDSALCFSTYGIPITIANVTIPCMLGASFTSAVNAGGQVIFTSTSANTNSGTEYFWNPGDGSGIVKGSSIFTHTYIYQGTYYPWLTLRDTGSAFCVDSTYEYVSAYTADSNQCHLNANFSYSVGVNGHVSFTNTSSTINANLNSNWNFGDGANDFTSNKTDNHVYTANGTYTVTLTASADSTLCLDSISKVITISDITIPCTLSASFTVSNDTTTGMVYVNSTSTGTYAGTLYTWVIVPDSMNKIIGYGSSTNLTFPANGSYTVWLIVFDTGSAYCMDSIAETVNISNVDSLHASFVTSNVYDTVGYYLYNFTSTSTGVNGVTMYRWDAGDTTGADSGLGLTTYQHYYKYAGAHTATLSIWFTQYPSMPHPDHGNTGTYNRYDFSTYSLPIDVGVTGITNVANAEAEFKLYPNPNNGSFKITLSGIENSQNAELQITNMLGEVIYTTQAHSDNGMIQQDINLPNINSGTYFVRVITNDKVYNTKTVITR